MTTEDCQILKIYVNKWELIIILILIKKKFYGEIRIFEVCKESPYKIFYKTELTSDSFKTIDIRKSTLGWKSNTDLFLNLAYSILPGITEAKKKIC